VKKNTALLLLLLLTFACKDKASESNSVVLTTSETCYAYKQDGSEVLLKIIGKGKAVTGTLVYAFKEKDRNTGSISGVMHGDTLFATYSYISEGIQGNRDVIFLRSENSFVEGLGEINTQTGEFDLSDKSQITFQKGLTLEKTECTK
jgi:hypothetical protein